MTSVHFWKLNSHSCIAPSCKSITQISNIHSTLPSIHLYCGLQQVNIRQKIQAQPSWWVCDTALQIGQHYITSIYFCYVPLIVHIFASHGKACKLSVLTVPVSPKAHQFEDVYNTNKQYLRHLNKITCVFFFCKVFRTDFYSCIILQMGCKLWF